VPVSMAWCSNARPAPARSRGPCRSPSVFIHEPGARHPLGPRHRPFDVTDAVPLGQPVGTSDCGSIGGGQELDDDGASSLDRPDFASIDSTCRHGAQFSRQRWGSGVSRSKGRGRGRAGPRPAWAGRAPAPRRASVGRLSKCLEPASLGRTGSPVPAHRSSSPTPECERRR
jgi:hypothetical protein